MIVETINALGQPMRAATCAHNTNGGQIGKNAWVPNLSYVKKFGCRWAAWSLINAPFGLATDYNDEWFGVTMRPIPKLLPLTSTQL